MVGRKKAPETRTTREVLEVLLGEVQEFGRFVSANDVASAAARLHPKLQDLAPREIQQAIGRWLRQQPNGGIAERLPTAKELRSLVPSQIDERERARRGFVRPRPEFMKAWHQVMAEAGLRSKDGTLKVGRRWDEPPAATHRHRDWDSEAQSWGRRHPGGDFDPCPACVHTAKRKAEIAAALAKLPEPVEGSRLSTCRRNCDDGWLDAADGRGVYPCTICRPDLFRRWAQQEGKLPEPDPEPEQGQLSA